MALRILLKNGKWILKKSHKEKVRSLFWGLFVPKSWNIDVARIPKGNFGSNPLPGKKGFKESRVRQWIVAQRTNGCVELMGGQQSNPANSRLD